MKNLELQKCILGPVYTNCYLLKNKETGRTESLLIPQNCLEKIEMKISRNEWKTGWRFFLPMDILTTFWLHRQ